MAIVGKEVFTFVEGEGEHAMWVACWRRFDVVAQGKTEREAYQSLIRTIAGQAMVDAEQRPSVETWRRSGVTSGLDYGRTGSERTPGRPWTSC